MKQSRVNILYDVLFEILREGNSVGMNKGLRVVVMGIMGQTPLAGVSLQVLQYLEGFRRLGCECYYVEDTNEWPFNPELTTFDYGEAQNAVNCEYAVNYVSRVMTSYGFGDRWAYRPRMDARHDCRGRFFGLSDSRVVSIFRNADILFNLTGSTRLLEEHLRVPVRVYLETDPVLRQIEVFNGNPDTIELLNSHTHHFTYAENIGAPDCGVPMIKYDYRSSRPPVVADWWRQRDPSSYASGTARNSVYTTISNWAQTGKDVEWNGESYFWNKHLEFLKFIDLPQRASQRFELALLFGARGKPGGVGKEEIPLLGTKEEAIPLLKSHGWLVRDAISVSQDIHTYRDYILASRGEFTVSKDQYVRLRTGWFSDRSACYLAAGRPVVTQDTGFGNVLPTGLGLFSFKSMEDIVAALEAIESDYDRHCRAARELAADYFAVERVLVSLMQDLGF